MYAIYIVGQGYRKLVEEVSNFHDMCQRVLDMNSDPATTCEYVGMNMDGDTFDVLECEAAINDK